MRESCGVGVGESGAIDRSKAISRRTSYFASPFTSVCQLTYRSRRRGWGSQVVVRGPPALLSRVPSPITCTRIFVPRVIYKRYLVDYDEVHALSLSYQYSWSWSLSKSRLISPEPQRWWWWWCLFEDDDIWSSQKLTRLACCC